VRLFFLLNALAVTSGGLLMAGPTAVPVLEYPAAQAVAGEVPAAIAVDKRGYTYITGTTVTPQRALSTGAGARIPGGSGQVVYVTQIDPSGARRGYTAYLGGSGLSPNWMRRARTGCFLHIWVGWAMTPPRPLRWIGKATLM
jgi:hypothetical protein